MIGQTVDFNKRNYDLQYDLTRFTTLIKAVESVVRHEVTYFLTVLPANATFVEKEQATPQVSDKGNRLSFNSIEDVVQYINESKMSESVGASVGVSVVASNQVKRILNDEIHDKVIEMLVYLKTPQTRADVFNYLNLTNQAKNRMRYLHPLINFGWIEMTIPNKPTSPKQKYRITDKGIKLLTILQVAPVI